jgi:hypothetical protein
VEVDSGSFLTGIWLSSVFSLLHSIIHLETDKVVVCSLGHSRILLYCCTVVLKVSRMYDLSVTDPRVVDLLRLVSALYLQSWLLPPMHQVPAAPGSPDWSCLLVDAPRTIFASPTSSTGPRYADSSLGIALDSAPWITAEYPSRLTATNR